MSRIPMQCIANNLKTSLDIHYIQLIKMRIKKLYEQSNDYYLIIFIVMPNNPITDDSCCCSLDFSFLIVKHKTNMVIVTKRLIIYCFAINSAIYD